MSKGANKPVTGLEIATGYIAAVKGKGPGKRVEAAAVRTLPADIVREGEVADAQTLAEELHLLFSDARLPHTVRVGVCNQSTAVRFIDLPLGIDRRDISDAVRFQMPETVSLTTDEVIFSHHLIGVHQTAKGPRTRVVAVAAHRQMIADVVSAVRGAGLKMVGIDLSAFALIRALYLPQDSGATVAYLGISGQAHLSVALDSVCGFSRVLDSGQDQWASQLLGRLGIPRDRAHETMVQVGIDERGAGAPAEPGESELTRTVRESLGSGVERLAQETSASLDFLVEKEHGTRPDRLVVSGPGVAIPGLPRRLAELLEMPVQPRVLGKAPAGIDPAHLQVATGLTVAEASV